MYSHECICVHVYVCICVCMGECVGGGCLSVYAHACERRVGRYSRMMRGEDMVVVSIRNYTGRSTIACPRKGEK